MATDLIIDGTTNLLGLIGWPLGHSFSPPMHNAAAAELGLNYVYLPLPVRPSDLKAAVHGIPALGFRGVNVTVPHKQTVIPLLGSVEPGAKIIGAVNTIVVKHNPHPLGAQQQLVGHNTDWLGFLADLDALQIPIKGRDCLILGAGGSARAIVYALAQAGAVIHLLARRIAQAQELASDFSTIAEIQADLLSALPVLATTLQAPLIVNTTPVGMSPNRGDTIWPDNIPFPPDAVAYDLVYNPLETRFMQQAQAAGCQSSNGLGMLIHQGAFAFELWTGQKPNIATMEEALPLD